MHLLQMGTRLSKGVFILFENSPKCLTCHGQSQVILRENIDLNVEDISGKTPLMNTCINGQKKCQVAKNIDLNGKDISGKTSFMNACINGHKDVVHNLFLFLLSITEKITTYLCPFWPAIINEVNPSVTFAFILMFTSEVSNFSK